MLGCGGGQHCWHGRHPAAVPRGGVAAVAAWAGTAPGLAWLLLLPAAPTVAREPTTVAIKCWVTAGRSCQGWAAICVWACGSLSSCPASMAPPAAATPVGATSGTARSRARTLRAASGCSGMEEPLVSPPLPKAGLEAAAATPEGAVGASPTTAASTGAYSTPGSAAGAGALQEAACTALPPHDTSSHHPPACR